MSDQDELLLGTAREPVRDSDGDGVTDTQETLDGTDPNDAGDSIRHDDPALTPRDTNDPRGDLHRPGIDEVVDVTSTIPDGKSIEQALPNGLDGKAIPTGPNHHGNADADKFFDGHSTDQNSPLNMERNPLTPAATPTQPGTGQAQHGSGSFTTAVGVAGTGSSTSEFSSGNIQTGPPPGEPPSGSADPDNNMGLVSADKEEAKKEEAKKEESWWDSTTKAAGEAYDSLANWATGGGTKCPEPPGPKVKVGEPIPQQKTGAMPRPGTWYSTDPDADTSGGAPTDDAVARAIAVRGGATDVVRGHGTPQIQGDAPPGRPIDLVTDGGDGDASVEPDPQKVNVPGLEISHTINPNDGIGPTRDLTGGGQGGGGQGDGGQGDGLVGVSSAATAADAVSSSNASGSGVVNIGTGSTGGISSVTNGDGTDEDGDSGLASQSSAMTAAEARDPAEPFDTAQDGRAEAARDSDGDGVNDIQEGLDGTDANDAGDGIRHDDPALAPRDTNDPRGDLHRPGFDGVVDVTSNIPDGRSIEQALPNGLDGKALPTGPNHYGNADADKFFDGRATDENSPLNVERDPLTPAATSAQQSTGQSPGGGKSTVEGGPPPGEPPSGSADPGNNMGLVSQNSTPGELAGLVQNPFAPAEKPKETAEQKFKRENGGEAAKQQKDFEKWKEQQKGKNVNPDADTSGGVPTEDEIRRAITIPDAATDVVRGHTTPEIDDDAPPPDRHHLVRDPGADGIDTFDVVTSTVTPPGLEISKPVNPNDGLGPSRDPSRGSGGGQDGGGQDGGGQGDGHPGLVGVSSAATAADATNTSNAPGSGVTNIGTGSTGGINTVGNGTGADGEGTNGDNESGLSSQSSAMMAGDDDDLEELEVQRADMAAAGPGTQTEDEIYIGVTSAPVDPSGTGSTGGSTGADAPAVPPAQTASLAEATVAEIFAPVVDLQFAAEVMPDPLDPVAAAMDGIEAVRHDAPTETFAVLEADLDLPVPAEVDLDDGL